MIKADPFREKNYFPTINLLRGIAALMVCYYHFGGFTAEKGPMFPVDHPFVTWAHYSINGIYIFFVISGFVIPFSMFQGNYKLKKIGKFLLKRSIRIEPPYLLSIALILGFNSYLAHQWGIPYEIDPVRVLLHLAYLIPFTFEKYEWYGIIYWTLAIEFMFYIFIAFIYPFMQRFGRVALYSGILLFLAGPYLTAQPPADYFQLSFLPLYLPCFLVGFLLLLYRTKKLNAFEMLVLLVLTEYVIYRFRGTEVVIATLFTFFFIWKVKSDTWIGNRLGDISYSVYLIHGIIGMRILGTWYDPNASMFSKMVLQLEAFGGSLLSAVIFYWIIEKWSKRWSKRITLE